jgi:hypothetical protein
VESPKSVLTLKVSPPLHEHIRVLKTGPRAFVLGAGGLTGGVWWSDRRCTGTDSLTVPGGDLTV